jgi:RNA polymerase sigma-70 factor (ECF subfamily)
MTSVSAHNPKVAPVSSWTEPDFAPVLSAAKSGDGMAFERLYRWMAPQVTNFAAARGVEDAEGITNEVFLRVFGQIINFEGGSAAFRAWVFAIARNQVIDAQRAAARRPRSAGVDVPDLPVGSAESFAMASLGSDRVRALLAALSDDQRDVILLRSIADLSLKQVAVVVDKPVSAVKALQRRGLRRLQSEILSEVVHP